MCGASPQIAYLHSTTTWPLLELSTFLHDLHNKGFFFEKKELQTILPLMLMKLNAADIWELTMSIHYARYQTFLVERSGCAYSKGPIACLQFACAMAF